VGVAEPERLVRICRFAKGRPTDHRLLYSDYVEYRDHATAFSGLATDGNAKALTDSERGDELEIYYVSASYFPVLGVQPHVGRFFHPEEDKVPGRDPVAVLSHTFWQTRFDADPRAVGRSMRLSGVDYRIVGVAPRGFDGTKAGWGVDVFIPNMMVVGEGDITARKNGSFDLIGRLAPGRTLADAQAEMSVLARQLEHAFPETNRGEGLFVSKLRGVLPQEVDDQARVPTLLSVALAALLAIACANLAGLLLSRNLTRQKELAIRLALGAARGRVVRQLLTESLVLSSAAAVAGLAVAWWGKALLERAYAREMFDGSRHVYPLSLDYSAFMVSLVLAVLTGLAFGLIPALLASRPDLRPALAADGSSRGPHGSRLRATFLVGQLALCLVLLVGAGLALRSARTIWRAPGFDAEHVAYFNLGPGQAGYRDARATAYARELRRRLESLPVVEAVTFAWFPPPLWFSMADVFLPGQPPMRAEDALKVRLNWVTPGFFEALKIPLAYGRGVLPRDLDQRRPVAVVNEALARRLWPGGDPVGRTLMVRGKPFDVIGVAHYEDLRAGGDTNRPFLFCSDPEKMPVGNLLVRVKGHPQAAMLVLRREIRAVDATVPVHQQMPLTGMIANQYADIPLAMGVLTFAGGMALLLTALGLYGAVALAVTQRTREIGIRVALGASITGVIRLALHDGMRVVAAGITLGIAAALAGTRLVSHELYGVAATDLSTFVGGIVVLAAVASIACVAPARRAARIDPVQALRHE
jgi:predicted permease